MAPETFLVFTLILANGLFAMSVIVLLNGIIGFIQEYRAERALEALQQMAHRAADEERRALLPQTASSHLLLIRSSGSEQKSA